MEKVLIDTDVVIDYLTERVPFDKFAIRIFALCETKVIEGHLTPVIVANAHYILRRKNSRDVVVEKLKQLLSIVEILEMSRMTVLDALNSDFTDFEDSLQYFAAVQSKKIGIILTRNVKDYRKSKIRVMTPEAYLEARNDSLN
ncbi:PIN domain-containing protein [Persicitalea jodogahamensis]|uniref:PIN domain-containing protein n=1 Tax=Persicitalea jodogahamensis TaxID=402147 RepID=A0A8J3G907_9BACT|nr:PIN domain-containing protein [Persicitalea jodogahamensis]GHB69474.1 PIN domain-containing protein [Persicitalea jodogahamensis]